MVDLFLLIAGIAVAGLGGELFVRGTLGLAQWARVSPGVIAATVAAFATSSPELAVAVNASLAGTPQVSLGDALGSNVVNVALILGIALSMAPMRCSQHGIRWDFSVALLAPLLLGGLFADGSLSRLDALVLLGVFIAWLAATLQEVRQQRRSRPAGAALPLGRVLLFGAAGLVLLGLAGKLIVMGATGTAALFGIDRFAVGALVVAVGTSVPELATAVIAARRGHHEVGLGTLLGSNIFNGLFVVPVAAMLHPITADVREVALALVFGLAAVAFCYPDREGVVERRRGPVLMLLYAGYVAALALFQA